MEIFLALAATVTKATDFVRNAADPGNSAPKWVWNLVAFGLGIAAALLSDLTLLGPDTLGRVVTGLAIGAAASGFHEVFDFFSAKGRGDGRA